MYFEHINLSNMVVASSLYYIFIRRYVSLFVIGIYMYINGIVFVYLSYRYIPRTDSLLCIYVMDP